MNRVVILFLILFNGCATFNYNGIDIYDRQVDTTMTREQIEELIYYTFNRRNWITILEQFNYEDEKIYWNTYQLHKFFWNLFKDWDFVFSSAWFMASSGNGKIIVADGMTLMKDKVIFLKVYKCYGHSAIIHEVAHIVRAKYGKGEDRLHEDTEYWLQIKNMSAKMTKNLCPKNYKPDIPNNSKLIN